MEYHLALPAGTWGSRRGPWEPPWRAGVPDYLGLEGPLGRFPNSTTLQKSLGLRGKSPVRSGSRDRKGTDKYVSKFSEDGSLLCNDLEVGKSACICKGPRGVNNPTLTVPPACEHPQEVNEAIIGKDKGSVG